MILLYTLSSNTSKNFPILYEEDYFFTELSKVLTEKQNQFIRLTRMSDGAISVSYKGCPVGKIKLSGRNHWMQILKGMYSSKTYEGNLDELISHQIEWQNYIKRYL